jgi:GTPase
MSRSEGRTIASAPPRTLTLHPVLAQDRHEARSAQAQLDEAVGLVAAINLPMVAARLMKVVRPRPATLFGVGAVEEIAALVTEAEIGLVVVDQALTPVQQRNLERAWKTKVIDRTGLILEIFGERARTREGQLQVELASLTYQRSRLVRSWTHLERQRGGFGFLGGPGESQIEMDRRLIGGRIQAIKTELQETRRTRGLHRRARERVPYPVVALVGYTNAGKSTLFNRMAGADALAKDMLFATLDPTMRSIALPSGRTIILSDTVGFIADLPHGLVEAFRATLEEVVAADIIIHVCDAAHPDAQAQREDVHKTLKELAIDVETDERLVEVFNKLDAVAPSEREVLIAQARRHGGAALSALTGEGMQELFALLDARITADYTTADINLTADEGAALAWLYRHGEVRCRHDGESGGISVQVRMQSADLARFDKLFRGA